ncbi:MAG: CdaR family protein [Acidobacteriota bacterium]
MAYNPFRHPWLKLLSVALATLLWLTVAGDHVVERSMRVPLEFRNIPSELEIVGDPPTTVDVRLRGSSALLGRIEPREIVALLNLASARPGSRLFHMRREDVRTPYGVEVALIVPGTLALDLEKSGRRTVAIKPVLDGEPAPGFVTGRVTVEPPTVEVAGPESRLKLLTEATTEPVEVEGSRVRVQDVVTVGITDSAVRLVQPQSATVSVEVLLAPVPRELTGVPVRWRNLATGLSAQVTPTLSKITVRGRREAVSDLQAGTIDAFVDLAGLGPGRYNLRVQVDPSPTFGVSSIEPAVVDVTIK